MSTLIASIIWGLLFYGALILKKVYDRVPLKELKRRARSNDKAAAALCRAKAFGASLDALVWLLIGATGAGFFYVVGNALHGIVAVLLIGVIIVVGFIWIPDSRVNKLHEQAVAAVSPALITLLNWVHPALERLGLLVRRFQNVTVHTGLYEREDLVHLLDQQKHQPDNRISNEELTMAINALTFGQELVRDVLIAKRVVRYVSIDDTIGPVLMDELHDSGHSRFPVFDNKKDNVVGMLMLKDLVGKKAGGKVSDVVRKDVYYIHESENLFQTLNTMLRTKHHMFMVVNSFEEIVGIVTLEDILERILGKPIVDEFDQYEDLRAVAAKAAAKVHTEQKHEEVVPDEPQG